MVPILQPELSNPLYLKLVCETLKLKGLKCLPTGWFGLSPVIRAFLDEKEKQFSRDYEGVSAGANIISGSLLGIAKAIAQSGEMALPWSDAQRVVIEKRPQAATLPVLDWLVRAELLIEDGPGDNGLGAENVLRPAFERFGDFLIAAELLQSGQPNRLKQGLWPNQNIEPLFASAFSVDQNSGVIQALSVLLPEMFNHELPDLIKDACIRQKARAIA